MAGPTLDESTRERVRESYKRTGNISETARECKVYWATAKKYIGDLLQKHKKRDKSGERVADDDVAESFREHADGTATQTVLAPKLIQTYDDAVAAAGVPHWHPHQLRHAAASRVRAAAGLDAAQVILGHRHAQTTEIYAEADRVKAAEIMARVG